MSMIKKLVIDKNNSTNKFRKWALIFTVIGFIAGIINIAINMYYSWYHCVNHLWVEWMIEMEMESTHNFAWWYIIRNILAGGLLYGAIALAVYLYCYAVYRLLKSGKVVATIAGTFMIVTVVSIAILFGLFIYGMSQWEF